jgi:putative ABC transport system substrate-binding protein
MSAHIGRAHGHRRYAGGQWQEAIAWRSTIAFLVTLTLGLLTAPFTSTAQPLGNVVQIGWLSFGFASDPALDGLQQGLGELGYVEGQHLTIAQRHAEGQYERLPELAADLVRRRVAVLVAAGSAAILASQRATSTIPIVMVGGGGDPSAFGIIASLAHPGGNITGVSSQQVALSGKRLELLKEAVPAVSRIAALWNPGNPSTVPLLQETQATAQVLGVQLQVLEGPLNDFEGAFTATTSGRAEALIVLPDAFLNRHRTKIVDFAQRHRLAGIYPSREYVDAGGLMAYTPSWMEIGRRAAVYVDKLLKGAKPADLPVEQVMKFELIINLKTAKALGMTMPPSLLLLADEVIQ